MNWAKYRNQYIYIHQWVYDTMGKATFCSIDSTHKSKVFEWSNISKNYKKDINDWRPLCQSCHRKNDWTENAKDLLRKRNSGNNYHSKKLKQFDKNWKFVKEWASSVEVEKNLGILRSGISNVLSGRAHTAGNWRWSR